MTLQNATFSSEMINNTCDNVIDNNSTNSTLLPRERNNLYNNVHNISLMDSELLITACCTLRYREILDNDDDDDWVDKILDVIKGTVRKYLILLMCFVFIRLIICLIFFFQGFHGKVFHILWFLCK